nr:sulfatase-like hydrolase/transferase [uncultured Carboxylicivirga sp.]
MKDGVAFLAHAFILILGVFGFMYFLSINRIVFSLFLGPVLLLFLISAYLLYFQNVLLTSAILDVSLNTEWKVSREYLNTYMIVGLLILMVPVVFIYIYRWKNKKIFNQKKFIHFAFAILLMIPVYLINNIRINTYFYRVPLNIYSSIDEYVKIKNVRLEKKSEIGLDVETEACDSLKVILIIGESVRNDHLTINGYSKNTTPCLIQDNVIPLPRMRSLYSYTAASLPQLLTRADSINDKREYTERSFISVFKRCNYNTYWIANQTPDYTYYDLAKEANYYTNVSVENSAYSDKLWTDQNILDELQRISFHDDQKELIVLHSIGSHWYYQYRYPANFSKFKPTLKSRSIYHNTPEEIINSYDNTILFMDYFVSKVIKSYEDKTAIVIFLSDHGELLGEDGNWLHAIDHDQLYNSACFIWMSEKYKTSYKHKYEALLHNSNTNWTTAFLFHSILSAGDIKTEVINKDLDVFSDLNKGLEE